MTSDKKWSHFSTLLKKKKKKKEERKKTADGAYFYKFLIDGTGKGEGKNKKQKKNPTSDRNHAAENL